MDQELGWFPGFLPKELTSRKYLGEGKKFASGRRRRARWHWLSWGAGQALMRMLVVGDHLGQDRGRPLRQAEVVDTGDAVHGEERAVSSLHTPSPVKPPGVTSTSASGRPLL